MVRYTLCTLTLAPELRASAAGPNDKPLGFSKPLAVAIYLCAKPGARATRDELIDLLWQGAGLQDARGALRRVVSHLRKTTGPDVIAGEEVLTVDKHAIEFDVDVFHSHLKSGARTEAIGVYEADFLGSVSLPGAREFELWAEALRRQLAVERRQVIRGLIAEARDSARWKVAAHYARLLALADPLDFEAHVTLVECLTLAGDVVAASAAAEGARRVAVAERGDRLPPAVETSIGLALTSTGARERPASNGLPESPEMVGRASQYRGVVDLWTKTLGGSGGTAFVTGEAGIGKTRLVHELETRFHRDGGLVLSGACYAVERSDPFSPFLDLIRQSSGVPGLGGALPASLGVLAAFVPEVAARFERSAPTPQKPIERELLAGALIDAFAAIAAEPPLVLILEDLHWASPATIEFAHRLARRATNERMLVVLTARDVAGIPETTDALRALAAATTVEEIVLGPLSASDVEQLLAAIADVPGDVDGGAFASKLVRHSGGIPLRVLEMLKALEESGDASVRDGAWQLSPHVRDPARDLSIAPTLQAIVEARLDALGSEAVAVYTALAVWGRESSVDVLMRMTRLDEAAVQRVIGVLAHRRWLSRMDGAVRALHEELTAAALRAAPAATQTHLHARAADVLEESAKASHVADWARTAHHAALAGEGDRAAVAAARAAAVQETRAGRAAAREALGLALEGLPPGPRAALLLSLAPVLEGRWSADRWLAERDGRAARFRRRIGAAAVIVLLIVTYVVTLIRSGPASQQLGEGTLVIGRAGSRERYSPIFGIGLDPVYAARRVVPDSLPPGIRDGFAWEVVSQDYQFAAITCRWSGKNATSVCKLRLATNDTSLMAQYEEDAGLAGWLPGGGFVIRGMYRTEAGEAVYALAIGDTTSTVLTTIARGEFDYAGATVSPAGDRLIAWRRTRGDSAYQPVVLDLKGNVVSAPAWCEAGRGTVAWSPDGSQLACVSTEHDRIRVGRPEAKSLTVEKALPQTARTPTWSPDGRFIALLTGNRQNSLVILQADGHGDVRPIDMDIPDVSTLLAWVASKPRTPVARLRVMPPSVSVEPGQLAPFVAAGVDERDETIPDSLPVRWEVVDATFAHVNDEGHIVADRPGTTKVVVSLGPFLSDTGTLVVAEVSPPVVLADSFEHGLDTNRWKRFGYPLPDLRRGEGRRGSTAFHNNGDRDATSGVYSVAPLDWHKGLTVEYSVRVPFSHAGENFVYVELWATPEPFRGGAERHDMEVRLPVTANVPVMKDEKSRERFASLGVAREGGPVPLPPGWSHDRWHRFRLVIYPTREVRWFADGTEFEFPHPTYADLPPNGLRLAISGKSFRRQAMVDDLVVWQGVVLDSAPKARR